ncbi:MAG: hypothetical protein V1807_02905 [Patescibacteria group bacterium]
MHLQLARVIDTQGAKHYQWHTDYVGLPYTIDLCVPLGVLRVIPNQVVRFFFGGTSSSEDEIDLTEDQQYHALAGIIDWGEELLDTMLLDQENVPQSLLGFWGSVISKHDFLHVLDWAKASQSSLLC